MDRQTALHFGVGLAFFSVLLMGVATNWLAAAILAVSILFYVFVYTIWLKRRTPQNIVIGGAAGAFPPLIGWAAATGDVTAAAGAAVRADLPVDAAAFLGAVAVRALRLRQGRRADAAGGRRARRRRGIQILLYTLPMAAAAVAPWPLGLAGAVYGVAAAALSARLPAARRSGCSPTAATEPAAMKPEKRLFAFSILYLFAMFGALVADRWLLRMTPAEQERGPPPPAQPRDRHGAAARRLRHPGLRDHHRQDGPAWPMSAQRRAPPCSLAVPASAAMVGLAFASVPLYRMFCQVTGFGGTHAARRRRRARRAPTGRMISVRFDANVAPGSALAVPSRSTPTARVAIGARNIAFFTARNLSDRPVTGTATFNVTPSQAGQYFTKIQCFCFTEQTLQPGQEVRMPVVFYVDPGILDDPDARDISEITLSYTFYPVDRARSGS